MHILLAGGGTAGHINPALAIAGTVRAHHPDARISFIGTERRLESKLVPEAGYPFYAIDVEGFQRSLSLENLKRNLRAAYKAVKSSRDARRLLLELHPDLVIGTGGYVSGPVVRQAQKLGIKTAIHEQNAYPGVTNKMLCKGADAVLLAMPEAEARLELSKKPILTGNPIRPDLLHTDRNAARRQLGLDPEKPMILSFGGSLGAPVINEAAAHLLAWHWRSGKYYHIHGTGASGYKQMRYRLAELGVDLGKAPTVRLSEYIHDMDLCMAAADLVICRAGAITLSELQVQGKAALLIPSPYVAENHQYHNAMALQNRGAAVVMEEQGLSFEALTDTVRTLLSDPAKLKQMGERARESAITDANERIYQVIRELLSVH